MANDGKIYITISDYPMGGDGANPSPNPNPTPTPQPGSSNKEKNSSWSYAKDYFVRFAEQQAQEFVNYSIQNIGNFTGNYIAQTNIQAIVSEANIIKGIASATIAGAQIAGAPGAMVGFITSTASTIINYSRNEYSNRFAIKKQNNQIEYLRDISGLNTLTNGSR